MSKGLRKFKNVDDLVFSCWQDYADIGYLNGAIQAENEGTLHSESHVRSPFTTGRLKDAVYSLDSISGDPEQVDELRRKLATACNAGLYFSLALMNSHLVLHEEHYLEGMSGCASEYAKCLKKLGLDVPKEALNIGSRTKTQAKRMKDNSVKRNLEKWLMSCINRDKAPELRAAVIGLYNQLIAVNEAAVGYADAVARASDFIKVKPGELPWEFVEANELEELLSNVEIYLSANSTIHTMISNAQKALQEKDWYMQEFEPIEKPVWAFFVKI